MSRLRPHQDPEGLVSGWLDGPSRTLVLHGKTSRTLVLPGYARRSTSYAAYAIGNEARRRGTRVTAWRVTDLLRCPRSSDLEPARPVRALDAAVGADLAILDDLGGEYRTAWAVEQVAGVMDARTSRDLRTIVTTNLGPAELLAAYGEPFTCRLLELATAAKIEG